MSYLISFISTIECRMWDVLILDKNAKICHKFWIQVYQQFTSFEHQNTSTGHLKRLTHSVPAYTPIRNGFLRNGYGVTYKFGSYWIPAITLFSWKFIYSYIKTMKRNSRLTIEATNEALVWLQLQGILWSWHKCSKLSKTAKCRISSLFSLGKPWYWKC